MSNKNQILIIDDEEKFRQLLSRIIELEGFEILLAADAKGGLKLLNQEKNIDLVLTDVKLPDDNGIDLLQKIKVLNPHCEIIVMTAYGTIHDGVKAMKLGAFDYFTKGDDNEQIIPAIHRAIEKVELQKRIIDLEKKLNKKYSFDTVIGTSSAIKNTIHLAEKVAPTDSTVLLEGETGTGKELFAQSIHHASKRNTKPFIAVNCSAFPKDLLESELFGYKKGAFTNAATDKKGLLEEANEGTLFLDEIGEMHLDLQAKLLRVLETQSFYKLGDSKPTTVNIRIIAATNKNLQAESEKGNFRSDLFYRLSVFQIQLPSLNSRKEDIKLLAEHFLQVYAAKANPRVKKMSKEFIEQLTNHNWKGNIRELKNIIERAVILTEEEELTPTLLPFTKNQTTDTIENLSMASIEKQHIQKLLSQTQGNKAEAAKLLGIGLTTLYRKLEEYKIV